MPEFEFTVKFKVSDEFMERYPETDIKDQFDNYMTDFEVFNEHSGDEVKVEDVQVAEV